jgi:PAS domain S-box-containing protein
MPRRVGRPSAVQESTIYQSILGSIRDPIVVLNADLRVVTVNDAFYKTFKVTAQETEDRCLYDLGDGQWNIPKLRDLLADILPRHSFFDDFEVTHDFEIIGRRTMLLSAREMAGPKKPSMIVLSIQDITERLQYQAHVWASEIRYRRLFEAAQDGILVLDPVSRTITEANSAALEVLGFPSREILGKELWEIGLFSDEQASHHFFRRLQQNGSVKLSHLSLSRKTGLARDVEVVSTLYEETGKKVIQCHLRDITERKRAEQALRESERRLELALTAGRMGAWEWDIATGKVVWSPGLEEIHGRTPGTFDGTFEAFKQDIHPDDVESVLAHIRQAIESGGDYHVVYRMNRPDGHMRWLEAFGRFLLGGDGKPQKLTGICMDITERKQAEDALTEAQRDQNARLADGGL